MTSFCKLKNYKKNKKSIFGPDLIYFLSFLSRIPNEHIFHCPRAKKRNQFSRSLLRELIVSFQYCTSKEAVLCTWAQVSRSCWGVKIKLKSNSHLLKLLNLSRCAVLTIAWLSLYKAFHKTYKMYWFQKHALQLQYNWSLPYLSWTF